MNVVQTQIIAFVQNHPSLTFFNQGSIKPKLPNLSYADSLETFNRYPGIRNEQKTIPWKISDNREIPVDFWKIWKQDHASFYHDWSVYAIVTHFR